MKELQWVYVIDFCSSIYSMNSSVSQKVIKIFDY